MPTTKKMATKAAPKKKTASVLKDTSTGKFASKASEKTNPGATVRITVKDNSHAITGISKAIGWLEEAINHDKLALQARTKGMLMLKQAHKLLK